MFHISYESNGILRICTDILGSKESYRSSKCAGDQGASFMGHISAYWEGFDILNSCNINVIFCFRAQHSKSHSVVQLEFEQDGVALFRSLIIFVPKILGDTFLNFLSIISKDYLRMNFKNIFLNTFK